MVRFWKLHALSGSQNPRIVTDVNENGFSDLNRGRSQKIIIEIAILGGESDARREGIKMSSGRKRNAATVIIGYCDNWIR